MTIAAAALLYLPPLVWTQQPAKASLQGVVQHAHSGEYIVGARVTLTEGNPPTPASQTPPTIATASTSSNGGFRFEGLNAGAYKVTVMINGYVRRDSAKIDLGAGQTMNDIVMRLTPTGNISGRVSSTTGRPLAGINVSLLRRYYNTNGTIGYLSVASARTNDLGEYRVYWVTPGRYYVTASGQNGEGPDDPRYEFDDGVRRGLNEVAEHYATAYFPGTVDISQASTIEVKEGGELRGIDLTLTRQHLFAIRGRLIDGSTGKAPAQASVMLSRRSLTGSSGSSSVNTYDPKTGTFNLPNLPPGRYGISVSADGGMRFGSPPAGTPWAATDITIVDSNVEDVVLTIARHPVITGRVRIEGQLPPGAGSLRVSLSSSSTTSISSVSLGNPSATVSADSTFTLSTFPAGDFRVAMSGLPAGFFLKEATLDGADVLKKPARFSVAGNLEVVINGNAAQVDGRVIDDQMRAVPGIEVVLIPDTSRNRSELFKRIFTDQQGRFAFPNITPGAYRLFAWEKLEGNAYFDEEVLKTFEAKGTPVLLEESSRSTVTVQRIPEDAAP